MNYIQIFFCITQHDELYEQKQQVMDYVKYCFEKEQKRIENKIEKNYYMDVEKSKKTKKWIRRFFEVIFVIEDEFCDFVDMIENTELLEKMRLYYNEYYKNKYKEKNLHVVTCPKQIYNNFAYALAYGEYYEKIITEIKHIKITKE